MCVEGARAVTRVLERMTRAALWSALALAAAGAAAFVARSIGSLGYRYPFEYGETMMVLPLLRMNEVPWIYGDIMQMPHHLMPYHPLYIYLTYLVSQVTDPLFGSVYTAGRTVTILASFVCAGWIYMICRRRAGAGVLPSAVAGLLFVASPFLAGEAIHVKPDITALALALGGFYFGTSASPRARTWSAAGLLFALAFLTKQNYLCAPAAVFVWRLIRGEWKQAVTLACISSVIALCGVGILIWGSGGNYQDHAFMVANPFYSWKIFSLNWDKVGPHIGALLACGLLSAAALAIRVRRASGAAAVYFFISALNLMMLGKSGAGENHAIEPLAAACMAVGALFGAVPGPAWAAAAGRLPIICVTAAQLAAYLPAHTWDPSKVRANLAVTESQMDEFIPMLKSVRGPILAENAGILLAAGLPVWYQPYEFAQVSYSGQFDQGIILNELRDKKYALIVVQTNFFKVKGTGRFTPEFVRVLSENYRFAGMKLGQYFYVPA